MAEASAQGRLDQVPAPHRTYDFDGHPEMSEASLKRRKLRQLLARRPIVIRTRLEDLWYEPEGVIGIFVMPVLLPFR
jgi:hypothetical protein